MDTALNVFDSFFSFVLHYIAELTFFDVLLVDFVELHYHNVVQVDSDFSVDIVLYLTLPMYAIDVLSGEEVSFGLFLLLSC